MPLIRSPLWLPRRLRANHQQPEIQLKFLLLPSLACLSPQSLQSKKAQKSKHIHTARTMEDDSQNRIPDLQLQPPTVDFIDNRLPSHHPMFMDPLVHYDPVTQRYVPDDAQSLAPRSYALQRPPTGSVSHQDPHHGTEHVIDATGSSPRPTWTDVNAMYLWNELFPEALVRFMAATPEPKDQADPRYSIRGLPDWDAIHAKLLECQSAYQEQGWFGRTRRRVADRMHPVTAGSRSFGAVMPDSVFSTPIVGVVQVILDVGPEPSHLQNVSNLPTTRPHRLRLQFEGKSLVGLMISRVLSRTSSSS